MKGTRNMATVSSEHIPEQPPTALTTQRKAAPWGYFFYCELLKIFRNPPAVIFGHRLSDVLLSTLRQYLLRDLCLNHPGLICRLWGVRRRFHDVQHLDCQ